MKTRVKKAKAAPKRPSPKRPSPKRPSPKRPSPKPPAGRRVASRSAAGPAARRPTSNVRPLHDRVLIRRIEEAEQAVGGIIIPDTAKEKPLQAEVIAVGSGRVLDSGKKVALTLQPGDKVLIGKWSGTEVKIDGEELLILKEDEVLGILS